ncbi:hypothetical protein [Lactobacillus gallinarum]|uniref:hypothetical protein n=1 Tax=Lactobacillus gallinarum TaxID=52242 RepID=UPI001749AE46|nr:hypothetical protein [Lactobacillus gallinarum]
MTDQERKLRILNKLKNIVYFALGITVLFLGISSVIAAHWSTSAILSNIMWILLGLFIIGEGVVSVTKSFEALSSKGKIAQAVDWILILFGIIFGNIAYLMDKNSWLIIAIIILVTSSIPIKEDFEK